MTAAALQGTRLGAILRLAASFNAGKARSSRPRHGHDRQEFIPREFRRIHLTTVATRIDYGSSSKQQANPLVVVGAEGNQIELLVRSRACGRSAKAISSRGESGHVITRHSSLTGQEEAAEILSVYRPHLIKLLDRGELPFTGRNPPVGFKIEDVLPTRASRFREGGPR